MVGEQVSLPFLKFFQTLIWILNNCFVFFKKVFETISTEYLVLQPVFVDLDNDLESDRDVLISEDGRGIGGGLRGGFTANRRGSGSSQSDTYRDDDFNLQQPSVES